MTIAICPGSSLERSSSVGAPRARARSDGFQEATKGTSTKAAPTAPIAVVAVVRNLRRLLSTSSSAAMTPFCTVNLELSHCCRLPRDSPGTLLERVRDCSFRPAGGGALYTNDNAFPGHGVLLTDDCK